MRASPPTNRWKAHNGAVRGIPSAVTGQINVRTEFAAWLI